jgi:rod shape-determining protein MreC
MLKRLYEIYQLFNEYLLFAICVVTSVALLALNDTDQIRSIRSFTLTTVGTLQEIFGFVPNYFRLYHENRILREMNLTLGEEVNRLRESRLENIRLRQLLNLKEHAVHRYVSANVVGLQMQPLRNTLTIDVGTNDSVRAGMPVVSERGLAGRVIATSSRYALVQLLLHSDLRVSAKVQRSRVDGIIRWNGGRDLTLTNVSKTQDVQEGDPVITSEYSSIFPSGIRIGIVSSARNIPGQLFLDVTVTPATDFTRLEEVFVVKSLPDTSRVAVERLAR